jgi:hypothetical protein
MKLSVLLVFFLISGCSKHVVILPFGFIQEQIEVSNLEGDEQCDRIHIDYRHECRAKLAKERKVVEDMSKAMKGNKQ